MRYLAASALSHDGLVRANNEDSVVVGPWTLCSVVTVVPETIYLPVGDPVAVAVADGLGGHPAGEYASSFAVRWLAAAAPGLSDEAALRKSLDACNQAIYAEAARDSRRTAMGTTIAGIVVTAETVLVFNVGDSRVYAFDDATLVRLSVDDNEPPAPGQARSSVVTQTLGGHIESAQIEPHLSTRPLTDTARYLLCSDGLTDAVDDDAIAGILRDHQGGRATFELWNAAIAAGGPDNISVALVEIATEP